MYIDPISVHDIPTQNARVAIVTKTSEVFRDANSFNENTTPDGKKYIMWGEADKLPYDIIDLIEADETLSTCQVFNSEVCYGAGLKYCTVDAPAKVVNEVEEYLLDNNIPDYFLGVCQDFKHFNFAVSVIILNSEGTKIVELHRKPACYCRFAPADPKTGKISKIYYGAFRDLVSNPSIEEIELLDMHSPWKDLQTRMGTRGTRSTGGELKKSPCRKFAIVSRLPGVDSMYYPIPHYASLFRSNWYNIKRLIGEAKQAKLKNAAPIKYIIEVAPGYWQRQYKSHNLITREQQVEFVEKKKAEMLEFLTNVENSGSVLFTETQMNPGHNGLDPDIRIVSVDSKTKEGGDWESDIAEAVNMICFTMRVHSNLVGSVPGNGGVNNSGSDKRELYTIAQALQKPYHDILFQVHQIIIRYNGWKGVHVDCPFIQLTTLDEHTDAKTVTLNSEK